MAYFRKRQAALVNELGWNKSRANMVFHGKQPYQRAVVNEISSWLGIEPFELLMPVAEALALRQLRSAAQAIAAGQPMAMSAEPRNAFDPAPPRAPRR